MILAIAAVDGVLAGGASLTVESLTRSLLPPTRSHRPAAGWNRL
jgi:hypothetical protein